MRQFLLTTALVVILFSCKKGKENSQEPIPNNKAVSWIKTYGGSEYDFANAIVQLPDGGYVVAGTSRSSDGDIPGGRWGYDSWVTKVDASGTKLWSKAFGANNDDYSTAIVATPDGGFIVVGFTFVNYQNSAWARKIDGSGNQVWEKTLNQSTDSKAMSILSDGDGSYIISGYTTAGASKDGMITRIDGNGTILWAKTYGGSDEDQFTSAIRVTDGVVLTGYTKSGNGEMQRNRGNFDGWVMKVDFGGNKKWSANFGGNNEDYLQSIAPTTDGGFIVAGYSKSTDGDIPVNKGGYDEWLIKIDANGAKQWAKTYGGVNEEYITNIVPSSDGGFVTAGYTNSTTGDVYRVNNDFGGWIIKIDANGNKTAASTYGTDRTDDFTDTLIPTSDGGYMMGGHTWVTGKGFDGWLVKIDRL